MATFGFPSGWGRVLFAVILARTDAVSCRCWCRAFRDAAADAGSGVLAQARSPARERAGRGREDERP